MRKLFKSKRALAPLTIPVIFWAVTVVSGLVGGGWFLSQANKTIETAGGGWLGIPVFGWVIIGLFLILLMRSR